MFIVGLMLVTLFCVSERWWGGGVAIFPYTNGCKVENDRFYIRDHEEAPYLEVSKQEYADARNFYVENHETARRGFLGMTVLLSGIAMMVLSLKYDPRFS